MISRTINQIHFEDLEPHRFEDLIRQLIYNFKNWNYLEATGKLGSDDGIDIRGYEKVELFQEVEEGEEKEDNSNERGWFIQCKREKTITPKKIETIISESFISGIPDCYILAAACNFSKKTRDIFREKMKEFKIKEFYLLGKAELEDMLYQEKNDSILFTFFGFSIHLKQNNIRSELKRITAIKRKLKKINFHNGIVIKEYNEDNYMGDLTSYFYFEEQESELFFYSIGVGFIRGKYRAYIDENKKEFDFDALDLSYKPWLNRKEEKEKRKIKEVPEDKRGIVEILSVLQYNQILEIDEIGDYYSEGLPIITIKSKDSFNDRNITTLEKNNKHCDHSVFMNGSYIKEFSSFKKIKYFK